MSCTLLTMYFNLKELQDTSSGTRPIEFYLKNGRGTLGLKYPMIIFCDSTTKPLIQTLRDELVGTEAQTVYIERNISDYDYYKLNWSIIRANRSNSPAYQDPHNRNTASYFLMGMFKILALQIANQRNDFNSTHFMWVDFGCGHVIGPNVQKEATIVIEAPRPKVAICYIHYRSSDELKNMETICNAGTCGIATTVFTVEKSYINKLYSCMWAIFYEKLSKGIGHTDETVFTYCYDRHPELFSLYYGDYSSTLSNYHSITKDFHSVRYYFIENALNANRFDLAKVAASNVYDSLQNGLIILSKDEKSYLESVLIK